MTCRTRDRAVSVTGSGARSGIGKIAGFVAPPQSLPVILAVLIVTAACSGSSRVADPVLGEPAPRLMGWTEVIEDDGPAVHHRFDAGDKTAAPGAAASARARAFHGIDHVPLEVPSELLVEGFTVELWIRFARGTVLSLATRDRAESLTLVVDDDLQLQVGDVRRAAPLPERGEWTHVAVSVSPGAERGQLFVDGRLVGSAAPTPTARPRGPVTLVIGQMQGCSGGCFAKGLHGLVDEVVLHRTPLPVSRLVAHVVAAERGIAQLAKVGEAELVWHRQALPGSAVVDLHPDGQVVFVGGEDGIVTALDVSTGTTIWSQPLSGSIQGLAVSADGRRLGALVDRQLLLLDPRRPIKSTAISFEKPTSLTRVPGSDGFLVADEDGLHWIGPDGRQRRSYPMYGVKRVWARGRSVVVAAVAGGTPFVARWRTGTDPEEHRRANLPPGAIGVLTSSDDGADVVVTSGSQIFVYDAENLTAGPTATASTDGPVAAAAVDSTTDQLLVVTHSGRHARYSLRAGNPITSAVPPARFGVGTALVVGPDGQIVSAGVAGGIPDLAGFSARGDELWRIGGGPSWQDVAMKRGSTLVAAVGRNGPTAAAAVWDVATGRLVANLAPTLPIHIRSQGLSRVAWDGDALLVVTALAGQVLRLDPLSESAPEVLLGVAAINDLAVLHDGKAVFVGGTAKTPALMMVGETTATGARAVVPQPHKTGIAAVDSNSAGSFCSGGHDGLVRRFGVGGKKPLPQATWDLGQPVSKVACDARVGMALAGGRVYRLRDDGTVDPVGNADAAVTALAVSEGSRLWIGNQRGGLTTPAGKTVSVHDAAVTAIAPLSTGPLITASSDGRLALLDSDGQIRVRFAHLGADWLVATPDGFFSGSRDAPGKLAAMRRGLAVFPLDTAVEANRPDRVMEATSMGSPEQKAHFAAVARLRAERRKARVGVGDPPTARITSLRLRLDGSKARLVALLRDDEGLAAVQINVAGVPLYPAAGRPVSGRHAVVSEDLDVFGDTRVEVVAIDASGQRSLAATGVVSAARPGEVTLPPQSLGITDLALVGEGRLWIGSGDGRPRVVDLTSRSVAHELPAMVGPVYDVAVAPDGERIAVGAGGIIDGRPKAEVVVWSSGALDEPIGRRVLPDKAVTSVAFAGEHVVAGTVAGELLVLAATGVSGDVQQCRVPNAVSVRTVATVGADSVMAGGCTRRNAATCAEGWIAEIGLDCGVRRRAKTDGAVFALAVDARRVYAGTADGQVVSFDRPLRSSSILVGDGGSPVRHLDLRKDRLSASFQGGTVLVLDAKTGAVGSRVGRPWDLLTSGLLSADGSRVILAGADRRGQLGRLSVVSIGETAKTSDLWFVGFGVSDYAVARIPDLRFAEKDVADLRIALERRAGRFARIHARTWTGNAVTRKSFAQAREFLLQADPGDTVVIFAAGHGLHDSSDSATFYYLVAASRPDDLSSSAVPLSQFERLLDGVTARNRLVLIDTCESGEALPIPDAPTPVVDLTERVVRGGVGALGSASKGSDRSWLNERERLIYADPTWRSGAIVLSSSRGDEPSHESRRLENGVFTEAIIKALTTDDADANKDGIVHVRELIPFVARDVEAYTRGRQHPVVDRDNLQADFGF